MDSQGMTRERWRLLERSGGPGRHPGRTQIREELGEN